MFGVYSGRELTVDEAVYQSESLTGHRNRAIGHMLRNFGILEEDPTLGLASPTVAWADTAFRAMHTFKGMHYPSEIRQPILMLAASNDAVVSTAAIEEFAYHLRAGSHLVIAGAKHEILQEQDRYRSQFWAAFDAFVPGTPLFK